ncbi:MAG TPA: gliding motility-associated C-terminal domain-containing protein, partial [Bacteroidetes bacterium]|nr:gliding motility-associated C-terminal domain-containing protein [Bacteroidota bacterium]
VSINASDSLDIVLPDTFTCNGGSIDIAGTFATAGIDVIQWSPTTGVSNPSILNPTISPSVATTYYLSGQNSTTGCGYTDSIRIETYQLQVNHWADSTVCLGDTLTFDIQPTGGTGNYSYMWLSSTSDTVADPTAATTGVRPTANGTFTVMISDQVTGCSIQFAITIEVTRLMVTATPPAELINPGQRVQLQAAGATFYSWAPDMNISCLACPDPVVKPEMSITYTVTGTDTNNCIGTATVNITVDSFLVPNVFTPNGDGVNDQLLLNYYGKGTYEISVFDRWGVQHFNTRNTNGYWDGRNANGQPVPEGVYYLVVRIIGDDAIPDKDKQRAFYVTLLR